MTTNTNKKTTSISIFSSTFIPISPKKSIKDDISIPFLSFSDELLKMKSPFREGELEPTLPSRNVSAIRKAY